MLVQVFRQDIAANHIECCRCSLISDTVTAKGIDCAAGIAFPIEKNTDIYQSCGFFICTAAGSCNPGDAYADSGTKCMGYACRHFFGSLL